MLRLALAILHLALFAVSCLWLHAAEAHAQHAAPGHLAAQLEARVAQQPHDATAWRLLGQLRLKAGDLAAGIAALQQAVHWAPDNVAAHFHLAHALDAAGNPLAANEHLRQAAELAPESQYGRDAREELIARGVLPAVAQASYEEPYLDGSHHLEEAREETTDHFQPFSFRFEAGALYNSNVALAPTSRGPTADSPESFQAFVTPAMELSLWDDGVWRLGPLARGHFTFNANEDFQSLNLQSYRGGAFVERTIDAEAAVFIPRVEYGYTHDAFDGEMFGQRHEITASLASHWRSGDITVLYWTVDHTDFADFGPVDPADDRDGWNNVAGLSHSHAIDGRWLRSIGAGFDLQRSDAGDNFAFNGVSLYADAEFALTERLSMTVEGGWGYRDYPDAQVTPSRNETIWRGGARLRYGLSDHWSVSGVFSYDRFDSENELFAAERLMAGVVTAFEF